jgi:hypothetical protein
LDQVSEVDRAEALLKTPPFNEKTDVQIVATLSAISAAGNVLLPGLITNPQSEHPDSVQCCYIPNASISLIPKDFMMTQFVSDDLRTDSSPDMAKFPELINPNALALIPF